MAFKFPKKIDEIEEGVLLPEEWYLMRVVGPCEVKENSKAKQGLSAEDGAGENFIIKLRVQHDNPKFHGRAFTKYLPMPREGVDDAESNPFTGQSRLDERMGAIVGWVEAFGGTLTEDEFDIPAGAEAWVPVVQERDGREGHEDEMVNAIPFNELPKPA